MARERRKRNETNPLVLILGAGLLIAFVIGGYYFFQKIAGNKPPANPNPDQPQDKAQKIEQPQQQSAPQREYERPAPMPSYDPPATRPKEVVLQYQRPLRIQRNFEPEEAI